MCNWSTEKLKFDNKQIIRDKVLSGLTGGEFEFPTAKPYFKNDKRLRAPYIIFEHTNDEIKSLQILKNNPDYIVDLAKTTYGFALRDYQKEALDNYKNNRFNIIIGSRQVGVNIILAIEALHYAITNSEKSIVIFSYNTDSAQATLERAKDLYRQLPYYSKPGIKRFNMKVIEFDNGSRIFARPLTKDSAIGFTIDYVIVDRFANISEKIALQFMQTLAPITFAMANSKMTIASTPGNSHFTKMVFDTKNVYHKQWIYYHQVPGRDAQWVKDETSAIGGELAFMQEYELIFPETKEWNRRININKLI